MPNRYHTKFSQSKISATGARPSNPSGSTAAMPQKQGFCSTALPGKASNAFAKAKKGIREVNGYANYKGLSLGFAMPKLFPTSLKPQRQPGPLTQMNPGAITGGFNTGLQPGPLTSMTPVGETDMRTDF